MHNVTLHYTTLHYIHDITLHYIALHYVTLPYVTLRYVTLHYITYITTYIIYIHYITLHYITLHYITLHYISLHDITLHYITLHYIHYTHYITLRYVTLRYVTLHYIAYLCAMFLLCCRSWTTGYGAEGEIVALRPKENAPSTASQSAPEVGSAGGGAGFDAPTPQLLEDFAQMSQEECSRRAEKLPVGRQRRNSRRVATTTGASFPVSAWLVFRS